MNKWIRTVFVEQPLALPGDLLISMCWKNFGMLLVSRVQDWIWLTFIKQGHIITVLRCWGHLEIRTNIVWTHQFELINHEFLSKTNRFTSKWPTALLKVADLHACTKVSRICAQFEFWIQNRKNMYFLHNFGTIWQSVLLFYMYLWHFKRMPLRKNCSKKFCLRNRINF